MSTDQMIAAAAVYAELARAAATSGNVHDRRRFAEKAASLLERAGA